jgi:predicted transcriptional regulator
MDRTRREVTEAELAVLRVLWDRGSLTIGQLTEALYPARTDAQYATVQKLLERLEEKSHVRRDRSGRAHVFSAVTGRDTLVGHRLRAVAEQLCGGMMASLLSHLVKANTLSAQDRQELRRLMDELDRKTQSQPNRERG